MTARVVGRAGRTLYFRPYFDLDGGPVPIADERVMAGGAQPLDRPGRVRRLLCLDDRMSRVEGNVLTQAAALLGRARRIVVFTGAGMSAESGVPTFRDDLTGLWARYDAQRLATPEAFDADPDLVWGWYEWRRARVRRAAPNPGHLAVTAIQARIPGSVVITQNVDDLHERAGSRAVVHLHGSLFAPRCVGAAGHPAAFADSTGQEPADPGEGRRIPPPQCTRCGALLRPGVVWFGEHLPETALTAAVDAAAGCDVLLSVGTSAVVYPAAEIPRIAARGGAAVIQVNPQPTALDRICTVNLRGSAAQILPELVTAAWDRADNRRSPHDS